MYVWDWISHYIISSSNWYKQKGDHDISMATTRKCVNWRRITMTEGKARNSISTGTVCLIWKHIKCCSCNYSRKSRCAYHICKSKEGYDKSICSRRYGQQKCLRVSGRSRHTLIQMWTFEPCFSSHLIGANMLSHTIKGNTQCTRLRTLNWVNVQYVIRNISAYVRTRQKRAKESSQNSFLVLMVTHTHTHTHIHTHVHYGAHICTHLAYQPITYCTHK